MSEPRKHLVKRNRSDGVCIPNDMRIPGQGMSEDRFSPRSYPNEAVRPLYSNENDDNTKSLQSFSTHLHHVPPSLAYPHGIPTPSASATVTPGVATVTDTESRVFELEKMQGHMLLSLGSPGFAGNLNEYLSAILSAAEFSEVEPKDLVCNLILPLLSETHCTTKERVLMFERTCKLLRVVSDMAEMSRRNDTLCKCLQSEVLDVLLDICKNINIFSQMAFETVAYLLKNTVDPIGAVGTLTLTRLTDDFRNPEQSKFREMRGEFLKALVEGSDDDILITACATEIKASLLFETSSAVRYKFKTLFAGTKVESQLDISSFKGHRRDRWKEKWGQLSLSRS